MTDERRPWDRRPRESTRSHERFRVFRDLGPTRTVVYAAEVCGVSEAHLKRLSRQWDWKARAVAWDDECRAVEDAERLEAIRRMHRNHQLAGRAAFNVAVRALQTLAPEELNAGEVVRLLDLGSRLERVGYDAEEERIEEIALGEDPWERIARELSGA